MRRDPQRLIQVFVVPGLIVGFNIVAVLHGDSELLVDPRHLSAVAIGAALWFLLFSSPASLVDERRHLWLLVAQPVSLSRQLLGKTLVWAYCAAIYLAAGFALACMLAPSWELLAHGAYALAAVAVFAALATSTGALVTDPLETRPQYGVKQTALWALMLVITALVGGIYAPAWNRLVQVVLLAALALASWQRFIGREAWLLDPTESPPPRLDLLDALIAIWLFFLGQSVIVSMAEVYGLDPGRAMVIAFAVSGVLVAGPTLLRLIRQRQRGFLCHALVLPARPGRRWVDPLLGAAAGGLTALVALAWLHLLTRLDWMPVDQGPAVELPWLLVMTVIAAPLCEELLFRGLLQRGLSMSCSPRWAVVLGALIFALVHPPVGFPAVFALGLVAGWLALRRGWLLAPIVAHAVYNLIVVLVGTG